MIFRDAILLLIVLYSSFELTAGEEHVLLSQLGRMYVKVAEIFFLNEHGYL